MKLINDHFNWQVKHHQTIQFNPEGANQSYIEFKKKELVKREQDDIRKKNEELEKIKKHMTVNKVNKSILDSSIPNIISESNHSIDHSV